MQANRFNDKSLPQYIYDKMTRENSEKTKNTIAEYVLFALKSSEGIGLLDRIKSNRGNYTFMQYVRRKGGLFNRDYADICYYLLNNKIFKEGNTISQGEEGFVRRRYEETFENGVLSNPRLRNDLCYNDREFSLVTR